MGIGRDEMPDDHVPGSGPRFEIPGSKSRTLVAVLALRAGRAVSVTDLVAHLWDGEPPASAVKNVQLYVHRVRRYLDAVVPGASRVLVRSGCGYRYEVDPDTVDALRIDRLVRRGGEALTSGRWTDAGMLLGQALAGWSPEGLTGLVPSEPVDALVAHWQERRLCAEERFAAAELELGCATDLVDRLRPLAAANPVREPLHELLMRALVQGGDRVGALQVYHRLRIRLRDELGLDPGPGAAGVLAGVLGGRQPA